MNKTIELARISEIKRIIGEIQAKLGAINTFETIVNPQNEDLNARYYCNAEGDYYSIHFGTIEITHTHTEQVLIQQSLDNYITLDAIYVYLIEIRDNITEHNIDKAKRIRTEKIAELERQLEGLRKV